MDLDVDPTSRHDHCKQPNRLSQDPRHTRRQETRRDHGGAGMSGGKTRGLGLAELQWPLIDIWAFSFEERLDGPVDEGCFKAERSACSESPLGVSQSNRLSQPDRVPDS